MSKKLKMLTSVVLATMVMASTLTGCSQNKKDDASVKKPVSLDFVWFTDGVEGEVMKKIIKDYNVTNSNVTINFIEVGYNDLNTKLRTMISGGKPPAMARVTEPGTFYNNALNLNDYVGGTDAFTTQYIDSIKPYYVKDDKILAAPMDVTANGLIYNKTLFKKAGIEVPKSADKAWTWDQMPGISKQLVDKGGAKYGMVWDPTPHRFSTILYEYGGSLFNADASKAVINDANGVKALDMFVKLHKEKVIPESVWLGSENANTLFRTGSIGMHLSGNWMLSNYKDIKDFEWGVTYLPKGTMNSSVPGAKFVMGFKGSKVEKETADFIKYLTSKEVTTKYCTESLFMSPRKDSSELNYSFGKDMFKVFAEELKNTTPKAAYDWSRTDLMPKINTDYKNSIIDALSGKATSKQALDKIADATDKVIADSK